MAWRIGKAWQRPNSASSKEKGCDQESIHTSENQFLFNIIIISIIIIIIIIINFID